jgi:hypothetical protein
LILIKHFFNISLFIAYPKHSHLSSGTEISTNNTMKNEWMVGVKGKRFHWVLAPLLTMVVNSIVDLLPFLLKAH